MDKTRQNQGFDMSNLEGSIQKLLQQLVRYLGFEIHFLQKNIQKNSQESWTNGEILASTHHWINKNQDYSLET